MVLTDEEAARVCIHHSTISPRQSSSASGYLAPPSSLADGEGDNNIPPGQNGFAFQENRMNFVGRVYSYLALQKFAVFGIMAVLVLCNGIKQQIGNNSWTFYGSLLAAFFTLIGISLCPKLRRSCPGTIISFILITLAEGATLGTAGAYFRTDAVLIEVGFVAFIFLNLVLFAHQTVWDFKGPIIGIYIFILSVAVFATLATFLRGTFPIGQLIILTAAATYFISLSVIGMQRIIGGEHKRDIQPDEFVFAAVTLYLDAFWPCN